MSIIKNILKKTTSNVYCGIKNILSFSNKSKNVRLPILCYHSVNDLPNSECHPISINSFEEHIKYLSLHYRVVFLQDLFNIKKTKQDKPLAAITFDDGYIDNYENVFPLIKKYKIPITIFVVTGFVNKEVYLIDKNNWQALSWHHLKEMVDSNLVDIGAHTHTHRILSTLNAVEVKKEIELSKKIIEKKLNMQVGWFAYPNGQGKDIPSSAVKVVKLLQFRGACSTFWRTKHRSSEQFLMNRIMVSAADTVADLNLKMNGGYDYLFYWHKFKALFSSVLLRKGVWK